MGLRPWEFRRVESVRDFHLMLDGRLLDLRLAEDRAGLVALHVLVSQGVTFRDRPAPQPQKPGEHPPTLERVLGRPPVDLAALLRPPKPPEVIAEEQAEAEAQREAQAAKLARAQMQLWEATYRMRHPERIVGEEPQHEAQDHG